MNGLGTVSFTGSQILATTATSDLVSLSALTVLVAEQNVDGTGVAFSAMVSHDGANADTQLVSIPPGRAVPGIGGRRTLGDSFGSSGNGIAVGANVRNIQGGVFDWANAALTYTQNGVLISRAVTFQTPGTTSANPSFALAVGGFAQEGLSNNGSPLNGKVSMVLMWLTAMTPEQLVPPSCYLRKLFATPW
jgi:hypothetical protein